MCVKTHHINTQTFAKLYIILQYYWRFILMCNIVKYQFGETSHQYRADLKTNGTSSFQPHSTLDCIWCTCPLYMLIQQPSEPYTLYHYVLKFLHKTFPNGLLSGVFRPFKASHQIMQKKKNSDIDWGKNWEIL